MRTFLNIVCALGALLSAACSTVPERKEAPEACLPAGTTGGTVAGPWGFAGSMRNGLAPATPRDVAVTGTTVAPVTAPGAGLTDTAPMVATAPTPEAPGVPGALATEHKHDALQPDTDPYQIVSAGKGLSLHKPMYILPATYSEDYHGRRTEMLFQISLKQRLFGVPLYVAYTQKSFFDIYDSPDSKPFRESDYNPELFYRYIPADREKWFHLGADVGIEHESNGKGLPDSRSWNRIYFAPFQAAGDHLIYWKWWWRLPEDKSKARTDPNRDDNPDITNYFGYSELHYQQQLFNKHLANAMFRWNPVTGHGAASLLYTIPNSASDPAFFWTFSFFQGYGESLIDYNHSITRVGIGVSIAR